MPSVAIRDREVQVKEATKNGTGFKGIEDKELRGGEGDQRVIVKEVSSMDGFSK